MISNSLKLEMKYKLHSDWSVFLVNVGHFFAWSFETLSYVGAPKGGVTRPQAQRNRNLKNTVFLYMTSNILHEWPSSRNQLLQSADEEQITNFRMK